MIYLKLFIEFLKVGLLSFGGAYGAIPLIRDVVVSNGWMTDENLAYMIAVSESTPGPIMVNLATYVGNTQVGILGACVATLGVVMPAFCIILIITSILENMTDNKYFQAVLSGLKPCVIGIIFATGLHIIIMNCTVMSVTVEIDIQTIIIMISILIIMFGYEKLTKKKLSSIMIIAISAIVGICICGII